MFGQYSAYSREDRTKATMLDWAASRGAPITKARKPGKNRLHWTTADGVQHFSLHETEIATLSADGSRLTLDDGGWTTMTTRRAMGDACVAFGLGFVGIWGARGTGRDHVLKGVGFNRRATFKLPEWTLVDAPADAPMIRALVDDGESVAVRYEDGHLKSEALPEAIRATPFAVLLALRQIDRLIRENRRYFERPDYQRTNFPTLDVFGFSVEPQRFGRTVYIGCHLFKSQDIRAVMRRIEGEHPGAAKLAKAAAGRAKRKQAA